MREDQSLWMKPISAVLHLPNSAAFNAQGQLATQVSHMKAGAQQVLDSFCGKYCQEKRQLTWHAHHPLGGQMLVEAAFVALPRPSGADVSSYSTMSSSLK